MFRINSKRYKNMSCNCYCLRKIKKNIETLAEKKFLYIFANDCTILTANNR